MAVYFVTGALGSGKGLAAVSRIQNYAQNGVKIAGNLDIYLDKLCTNINSKVSYIRVPDRPTQYDLLALGSGNDSYNPDMNSLLVLDELATWFNARTWQDKARAGLLDWLIHSRKHGWDVILIAQSFETLDKQLIDLLMEYHVPMSNLAKINIPVFGKLLKGYTKNNRPLKLPQYHIGKVLYKNTIKADSWTFRGKDFYPIYDTKQIFIENYPHGSHSQLSRWHIEGRYTKIIKPKNVFFKMIFYVALVFASTVLRIPKTKTLSYVTIKPPVTKTFIYLPAPLGL